MVWDDPGPAPIRHSPTKDGGSAAARRSGGGGGPATRRWQHLWRKCIHWHCTSVFGSFKHHHDCILPLSLLDGYSYCIFVISHLSMLICSLQFISVKIQSVLNWSFIHHKLKNDKSLGTVDLMNISLHFRYE